MRYLRAVVGILVCAVLISLASTPSQAEDPAGALKGFFYCVRAKSYRVAWSCMSAQSQASLIRFWMASSDVKLSAAEQRQLHMALANGDPKYASRAWDPLAKVLAEKDIEGTSLVVVSNDGAVARARGAKGLEFIMKYENGWKVAIIETLTNWGKAPAGYTL